jgi:hypothetical protein
MSARATGTVMIQGEVYSTLCMFMQKTQLFTRSCADMGELLLMRQPEQGIYLA